MESNHSMLLIRDVSNLIVLKCIVMYSHAQSYITFVVLRVAVHSFSIHHSVEINYSACE